MPPVQNSSIDKGYDSGHAREYTANASLLGRKAASRTREAAQWKMFVAFAMVAIMLAAAFAMIAPSSKAPVNTPVDENPARTQAPGDREVTYTISNIGESYVKDSRDVDGARGLHSSTPGLSEWWTLRKVAYSDTIIHNAFPYYVAYNPESGINDYNRVTHLSYGTYGYYRFGFDAKNLTNVATGSGMDPLYLPVLAPGAGKLLHDGGTVQLNWHITYLTSTDVTDALAGNSYINSYYGVDPGDLVFGAWAANDGWYIEQKGLMTFDRLGAFKFLGLDNTVPDMRTEFTANNAALNTSWAAHYVSEGGPAAIYDIYSCYDFSINSGPVLYFLSLDPASDQDTLVLRIWGYSWGAECLMMRYLDVQGILPNFIPWPEDWYFNATLTSTGADIQSRMTAVYHMTTWKDPNWWGPSYLLEAQHNDYNDLDGLWLSRFTPYMAISVGAPLRAQWEPGTNNIGANVAFWNTPTLWNLALGEKLVVSLGTGPHMGYVPYKGTVSDTFPKQGGGNDLKAAEMNTHKLWGELVLGRGMFPSALYSTTYYDAAAKTLTVNGPTSWARNPDSVFSELNESGSPSIYMDVSKVSEYELSIQGGPPTAPGDYTLVVTAKNYTGTTVTDWNGTVNLAVTGPASLASSTHAFVPGDSGVWTTTLTISGAGSIVVSSADSVFFLDVTDTLALDIIPEFPTLLVPVMAAAAMVVVFVRRRDKKKSA